MNARNLSLTTLVSLLISLLSACASGSLGSGTADTGLDAAGSGNPDTTLADGSADPGTDAGSGSGSDASDDGSGATGCTTDSDCADRLICYQDRCRDLVCAPTSTVCRDEAVLYTCAGDGSRYITSDCTTEPGCTAGSCGCRNGACGPIEPCTPGTGRCVGDSAELCRDAGDGFDRVDLCDSGAGELCVDGICTCDTGEEYCDGTCVNTQANALNCGACGNACDSSETCLRGGCICADGLNRCGDACVSV